MAARLTAFVVSAIVVVTFVAGLIVGAQREDDGGPADLIVHNAHVYLGASVDAAEALAIRDGKIVRVGTNKDIDRLRRRQTLDAQGGTVVPGLNDAGLELFTPSGAVAVASSSASTSTSAATSALASPSALASAPASASPSASTPGSAAAVSAASSSTAASSAAADPSDAAFTGLTRDQKLDALRRIITEAHHVGLTSVQTTISSASAAENLALLEELRKRNELKLRVFVALTATLPLDEAAVEQLEATRKLVAVDETGFGFVKVGAVNLSLRAATDARGNGSTPAKPRTNARKNSADQIAQLGDAIALLDRQRWQVILDTPTSADVALAADAFDHAFGEQAAAIIRVRRHRVELSAPLDAALTARIAALELVPSLPAAVLAQVAAAPRAASASSALSSTTATAVNAASATSGADAAAPAIIQVSATTATATATPATMTVASAAAGPARVTLAALLSNPRSILRSEFPTTSLDPLPVITAALASAEDSAEAVANALDAYTSRAAYATHDEPLKGAIVKDQAADLVIFSADLFAASTERPVDPIVIATIVNGKVVFTQTAPKPVPTEQ
jgi:predicted amidohydrolase YtcJ